MASVSRQTRPRLPRRRALSSSGDSGAPSLRSTSQLASRVASADEGMRRVSRTVGLGTMDLYGGGRLVSVGLAVAAVIALDGGFDEAGTVRISAGRQDEQPVARMLAKHRRLRCTGRRRHKASLPRNRVAHERPQL